MIAPDGPIFTPKASRSPSRTDDIFCCRSRNVSIVVIASRVWAASSYRRSSEASRIRRFRSAINSSFRPSRNSFVCSTASPYCSRVHRLSTHGAMHRLMSYSRQARPRRPLMTSLHERMPNSLWVSDIVFRARVAGRNGPA